MNATTAPQSRSNVSAEDAARADLVELRKGAPHTFTPPKDVAHRFCECCGSDVLDKDGTFFTGRMGAFARIKPFDAEKAYELVKAQRPRMYYQEKDGYTDKVYEEMLQREKLLWLRGNKPGVILGQGLKKDALINLYYTPDHELYGKVEGLEFNDPHDGLHSLIWTNA